MIPLSAAAESELDARTRRYKSLRRDRAIDRLVSAVQIACDHYEMRRGLSYDAPRPGPALADLGFRWTKDGSYWIAFEKTTAGPVVSGIFHEAADIPNRL
jgi:hypothetical protein